jgi:hypothetical protein
LKNEVIETGLHIWVEIRPVETPGLPQMRHHREKHILCLIAGFRVAEVFGGQLNALVLGGSQIVQSELGKTA